MSSSISWKRYFQKGGSEQAPGCLPISLASLGLCRHYAGSMQRASCKEELGLAGVTFLVPFSNRHFKKVTGMYTFSSRGLPAGGRDDDDQEDDGHNHPDDCHHLHVLPPVLPLETSSLKRIAYKQLIHLGNIIAERLEWLCYQSMLNLSLKLVCSLLKIVGPLIELWELAVPLQHLLHVDPHDVHHLPNLRLRLRQSRVPLLWCLSHPELFWSVWNGAPVMTSPHRIWVSRGLLSTFPEDVKPQVRSAKAHGKLFATQKLHAQISKLGSTWPFRPLDPRTCPAHGRSRAFGPFYLQTQKVVKNAPTHTRSLKLPRTSLSNVYMDQFRSCNL